MTQMMVKVGFFHDNDDGVFFYQATVKNTVKQKHKVYVRCPQKPWVSNGIYCLGQAAKNQLVERTLGIPWKVDATVESCNNSAVLTYIYIYMHNKNRNLHDSFCQFFFVYHFQGNIT